MHTYKNAIQTLDLQASLKQTDVTRTQILVGGTIIVLTLFQIDDIFRKMSNDQTY